MERPQGEEPLPITAGEELRARFADFDQEDVYQRVKAHGYDARAKNFVVKFGANKAEVALDLRLSEFNTLLKQNVEEEMPIRWINIWNPSWQRDIVKCIGKKYGFSSRLVLTIRDWDLIKDPNLVKKALAAARQDSDDRGKDKSPASEAHDVEREANRHPDLTDNDLKAVFALENVATFRLMQDSMNYTSIDMERNFLCIGANWLHRRPMPEKPTEKQQTPPSLVPPNHWSWFVLCSDHTVISFHEAAHFEAGENIPRGEDTVRWRQEELKNMRSNTLKVLRQLSTRGLEEDKYKVMQLTSVRGPLMNLRVGETAIPQHDHPLEGSSNLFFYLFEDYSAAVGILNHSKSLLEALGAKVLKTADWKNYQDTSDIIPSLYKLNKELRQLQHLFASYKTLINRLLANKYSLTDGSNVNLSASAAALGAGERLSKKARDRFERLRDQLQSLMLDTIQDYIDEKESLQSTYFNLTNQKDSRATARLTRSANLLAKLSVLFLPISLVTSYFSVQIPDLTDAYDGRTYWGTFGVVFGLSIISLFFFSRALMFVTDRLDHWSDSASRWAATKLLGRGNKKAQPKS